jgi:hypothetical protein
MKIRLGWVSNSSTTSFVLMGQDFDDKGYFAEGNLDYEDPFVLEKLREVYTDEVIEVFKNADWGRNYLWDILEEEFEILMCTDDEGYETYVGVDIDIGENETWAQFKERSREKIKRVFVNTVEPEKKHGVISS